MHEVTDLADDCSRNSVLVDSDPLLDALSGHFLWVVQDFVDFPAHQVVRAWYPLDHSSQLLALDSQEVTLIVVGTGSVLLFSHVDCLLCDFNACLKLVSWGRWVVGTITVFRVKGCLLDGTGDMGQIIIRGYVLSILHPILQLFNLFQIRSFPEPVLFNFPQQLRFPVLVPV